MDIVYLNGQYLPKEKATISVMDRGFLFGDGVYEVIPVYNGKPFRCAQHIDRLFRSLKEIKLPISTHKEEWLDILTELLRQNSHLGPNQSIYLQVTRGAEAIRNHAFPKDTPPTMVAFTFPLKTIPLEILSKGKEAITLDDTRWQFCNIKATSLLPNVLLYQQAIEQSAAEAILIRKGEALEGASSNLFIVKEEVIKTPPLSNYILGGITRELVLELAKQHGIDYREESISESALFDADEVWITSSTREIYPIIKINQSLIKQGQPGPMWHKMIKYYHTFIKNL